MRITLIHAPNTCHERLHLYEKLRQVSVLDSLPWLCLGDSNEMLYHWENVGRRMVDHYRLNVFRDCLNDYALMEVD